MFRAVLTQRSQRRSLFIRHALPFGGAPLR
jgi:hypothetical protein